MTRLRITTAWRRYLLAAQPRRRQRVHALASLEKRLGEGPHPVLDHFRDIPGGGWLAESLGHREEHLFSGWSTRNHGLRCTTKRACPLPPARNPAPLNPKPQEFSPAIALFWLSLAAASAIAFRALRVTASDSESGKRQPNSPGGARAAGARLSDRPEADSVLIASRWARLALKTYCTGPGAGYCGAAA